MRFTGVLCLDLEYLRNRLVALENEKRAGKIDHAAGKKEAKLQDVIYAQQVNAGMGVSAIENRINNMEIQNKVNFCTITLVFNEDEKVYYEKAVNSNNLIYKPGFFSRIGDAITGGWNFIKIFIIAIFYMWPAGLLGVFAWFIYRYFARKKREKKNLINSAK